ncbi:uncharacterized protein LOC124420181 [Lucilia cuprina]|uniref:uncharacterized protein LOC124420181 n=1 Tax=Lucilia cuprina TaxID=7375 RepID=UPI001F0649B8|nr:uncharacterized protein LOC124420181 [Lucilia cuprina]
MEDAGGGGPTASKREHSLERQKRRKIADVENKLEKGKGKAIITDNSENEDMSDNEPERNTGSKVQGETAANTPKYRYDSNHKGPYFVYVDSYDASGVRKYLNGIAVCRLLMRLEIKDLAEVVKIGYGRCKVIFNNYMAANNFVDDVRIMENGLSPKIFAHFVSKVGIVFDIPTDILEEEFKDSISSPIEVINCVRMMRHTKDKDGNDIKIPSRNMKVIFKGNEIPSEIKMGYIKIPVRHFVSFSQCYKCYRFNHFATHCKQNFDLCRDCYNNHVRGNPCADLVCVNCKGNHTPTDKNCPARMKAFAIKKMMVIENLSLKEARTRFSNVNTNRFSLLDDYNEDFPPIKNSKNKVPIVNGHQEAMREIHKILPYAKVAKNNGNRLREEANARETMRKHKEILEEHAVNLNYGKPVFHGDLTDKAIVSETQSCMNPRLLSQKMEHDNSVAVDTLEKASKEVTEALLSLSRGEVDMNMVISIVNSLRDNFNRGINNIDADRVNRMRYDNVDY